MKKIALFTALACLLVILQGCASHMEDKKQETASQKADAYHKIDAKEAKQMMEKGNVIIVDVRTEAEYKDKHIPDAILVPNETIEEEAKDKLPDKAAVYLVHCRTGIRSKQASDKLVKMGYQNIYDFGGINDWPYETVRE